MRPWICPAITACVSTPYWHPETGSLDHYCLCCTLHPGQPGSPRAGRSLAVCVASSGRPAATARSVIIACCTASPDWLCRLAPGDPCPAVGLQAAADASTISSSSAICSDSDRCLRSAADPASKAGSRSCAPEAPFTGACSTAESAPTRTLGEPSLAAMPGPVAGNCSALEAVPGAGRRLAAAETVSSAVLSVGGLSAATESAAGMPGNAEGVLPPPPTGAPLLVSRGAASVSCLGELAVRAGALAPAADVRPSWPGVRPGAAAARPSKPAVPAALPAEPTSDAAPVLTWPTVPELLPVKRAGAASVDSLPSWLAVATVLPTGPSVPALPGLDTEPSCGAHARQCCGDAGDPPPPRAPGLATAGDFLPAVSCSGTSSGIALPGRVPCGAGCTPGPAPVDML